MPRFNAQTMRHYKGNPVLKSAGVQMQYSQEQILERVKCTNDPEYFIQKYMKIVHVDRGLVSFDLYPFQKELLQSYIDERFVIAKLPRQVGKSTVTIAYIAWVVLFGPMQNIAILANKAQIARDILSKLQLAYEHIPLWMQQGIVTWNRGSIELENGSKIVAASTAKTAVRGNTYNCISGNSLIHVKINDTKTEIKISDLYKIIAKNGGYSRNVFNSEIQYVCREQVQKTVYENYTDRLFGVTKHANGKTPYNSTKHGRNERKSEYINDANTAPHNLPSSINQMRNSGISAQYGVGLCDDDTHQKIQKNNLKRVGAVKKSSTRILSAAVVRQKSNRNHQTENVFSEQGQEERTGALQKHFGWTEGLHKNNRTHAKNQSQPRKNTKDGRNASGYETERREQTENEYRGKRSCALEQRESRNLFARSFGENETSESGNSFDRRTQSQFEKIQVLTEAGYKDFHGIKKVKQQRTIKVILQNAEIICTPDHKLFTEEGYVEAKDCLGKSILNRDGLYYAVSKISKNGTVDVYDLLEVKDTNSYYTNDFLCHQCIFLDEFAFVPTNIAEEFITSVYPTISSGTTTKLFMVSTPNGMNLFYKYWTDAIHKKNLYKPVEAHWSVVPGRDAKWAEDQIKQIGQQKFNQEFNCVEGSTLITTEDGAVSIETAFNAYKRIFVVYKITRDDGQMYIGTTIQDRLKNRMSAHKNSKRFKNRNFKFEILEESNIKKYIDEREVYYINEFDTYENGLNNSVNGKGNHLSVNFTTLNYKYGTESKTLMSATRKGNIYSHKLSKDDYLDIRDRFEQLKNTLQPAISKNGKILSAERQFAIKTSPVFGITVAQILNILNYKTLR